MYPRINIAKLKSDLFTGRALILIGARQVGKTTIIQELLTDQDSVLWLNADEAPTRELFQNPSVPKLKLIIGNHKILVIDEAQLIQDIGRVIKIFTDKMSDVQVIATGSSSFQLKNKLNEPLTGRKWEHELYPLTIHEIAARDGTLFVQNTLEQRLIYGSYPEVVANEARAQHIINELTESYLFKDLFMWNGIKKSDKLVKLLSALAYQVGSQVSYNELSQIVQLDKETIERYIEILEQCYVLFRLQCYNKNLRTELKKSRKIYFYDNGIRNALINDLRPISQRNDIGALWENYMVSEVWKKKKYENIYQKLFFWRTQAQQEIDIVWEEDKVMHAIEIKWNSKAKAKFNAQFLETYQPKTTTVLHNENYLEYFLS